MRRRGVLHLLALLVTVSAAAAETALEVAIVQPSGTDPVFGLTSVATEIYPTGAAVERVEFFLDGLRMEVVREPPFRLEIDVGQENAEHLFEVVAYSPGGETAVARIRTPKFRSDLEVDAPLRQLYVTVTRDGKRLLDLPREAFTLYDDERPQQIVTFERGEAPFTAVLLVDASSSMAGRKLATALAGVRRFLAAMGPLDEARLILFSDRILLETPSTGVTPLITLGLTDVEAEGGTALNDALYLALKRLESRQGRRVIILLSDGLDIDSALAMDWVRRVGGANAAATYWIRLPKTAASPEAASYISAWRTAVEHRAELDGLAELVSESGGRIITLTNIVEVDGAFRQLLSELREQYVLGYYPSEVRGTATWHEIRVAVAAREVSVRTRKGYLEP